VPSTNGRRGKGRRSSITSFDEGRALETGRLRLEELAPRHAGAFLLYRKRNRSHLERWEPAVPPDAYEADYQEREIAASVASANVGESVRFLAFGKHDGEVIASVNLWSIRRGVSQSAVLGYSVDAACQRRGFATEAAGAVVTFAFDELRLHRVETSYQPVNGASGRVLRKLGFIIEGYARDYLFLDNGWRDSILASRTVT